MTVLGEILAFFLPCRRMETIQFEGFLDRYENFKPSER